MTNSEKSSSVLKNKSPMPCLVGLKATKKDNAMADSNNYHSLETF